MYISVYLFVSLSPAAAGASPESPGAEVAAGGAGTACQDQSSCQRTEMHTNLGVGGRCKEQGARFKVKGTRHKVKMQGARFKVQGSKCKVQVQDACHLFSAITTVSDLSSRSFREMSPFCCFVRGTPPGWNIIYISSETNSLKTKTIKHSNNSYPKDLY